ncbi:MAG: alpha/beta hydrolase [Clostridia bacterium]|nr:alpha/beta hydrolase [Clostridia bacterium]
MKTRNKLLIATGLTIGMAEMASEINYMFETILSGGNKLKLAKCTDLSREEKIVEEDNKNERKQRELWEKKSRNVSCYIKGYDDTPIYCKVYIQKKFCHKWTLVVHGYGGDGSTLAYASKKFYDEGYNVVVPDLRGHGKSGGRYIGMGQIDSRDIMNIIHLIIKGDKNAEIYLYGVSMGGASVLMTASEKLPANVKAVISDCSFDNANKIIGYELSHNFRVPPFPIVNILNMLCYKKAKYDLRLASPIDRVSYIKIPALFIHGDRDSLVPTKMVYRLYDRARCKKALMVIKDAGHGVSALVDGERYWRGVFGFIKKIS